MSKFNMNDKVRAHYVTSSFESRGHAAYLDGWISSMYGELLQINYLGHWFHEKQCRKLVKKKKSVDNKFICPSCNSNKGEPVFLSNNNDSLIFRCTECKEPKFKVGDFVTHISKRFDIGRIADDFIDGECVDVLVGTETYKIEIANLQKLNIKCEE